MTKHMMRWSLIGHGFAAALVVAGAASVATVQGAAAQEAKGQDAPGWEKTEVAPAYVSVNGQVISEIEFGRHLYAYARANLYHGGSQEEEDAVRRAAARELIALTLKKQSAVKQKIKFDKKVVNEKIEKLVNQYKDSPNWEEAKKNLPAIREKFEDDNRLEALEAKVRTVGEPGKGALKTYYDENLDLFTQPAEYHLKVILLGVDPSSSTADWKAREEEGKGFATAAREGMDFSELATSVSTHSSAAHGGDVGFVHLDQLYGPAQDPIKAMAIGEISEPVRVLEGYVIFSLEGKHDAQLRPLKDVAERAVRLYKRDTGEERWVSFQDELWENADLQVSEAAAPLLEQAAAADEPVE